jgi:D-proline reductase (dithiol) PrdB
VCHQSVGLIARQLEAAGLPTIGFSSARSITVSANPPRSVFVDLPLGHTTGLPHDVEGQRRLLTEGLAAAHALAEPGIVDLPYRYVDDDWKAAPLGWSRKRQTGGRSSKPAGDSRTARSDEPVYQNEDDRAAAEAVAWDDQCLVCVGIDQP